MNIQKCGICCGEGGYFNTSSSATDKDWLLCSDCKGTGTVVPRNFLEDNIKDMRKDIKEILEILIPPSGDYPGMNTVIKPSDKLQRLLDKYKGV